MKRLIKERNNSKITQIDLDFELEIHLATMSKIQNG